MSWNFCFSLMTSIRVSSFWQQNSNLLLKSHPLSLPAAWVSRVSRRPAEPCTPWWPQLTQEGPKTPGCPRALLGCYWNRQESLKSSLQSHRKLARGVQVRPKELQDHWVSQMTFCHICLILLPLTLSIHVLCDMHICIHIHIFSWTI